MGPRSIDRGTDGFRLIAERSGKRIYPIQGVKASMGPRSIDRGTKEYALVSTGSLSASMGPRSIDRGTDPGIKVIEAFAYRASMGPRSIDRGTTSAM